MPASVHRHCAALALCAFLTPQLATAQTPDASSRRGRVESLTLRLANDHSTLSGAPENAALQARLLETAVARRTLLSQLVFEDPSGVLRVALDPRQRESLPRDVQAYVEEHVRMEGEIETLHEDYDWGGRLHYFLHANGRRIRLHVAGDAPELLTGSRVRISGVLLADDLTVPSGASIQQVTSIAPYTFGEQRALMILVNFRDLTSQPYSPATAHSMLFNTVNSFYAENSQTQVWFTGDVAGWFTLDISYGSCDYSAIRIAARDAASASGVDLTRYRRFIYAFPKNACSWWGLGQVGGSTTHAWINGSLQLRVVAHELGHNFGLYHAHALECGSATLGTSCSTIDYGDYADIMGYPGVVAHFGAFAKERLGWLNYGTSAPILTVTGSGTFTLDPYAPPSLFPKALRVLKAINTTTGKKTWYYVEFRRGVGYDSALAGNNNLTNGVVIKTGSESSGDSSFVLDMTPATASWSDPALTVGNSFNDATAGVTISTVGVGVAGATVAVQMNVPACVPAAPTVAIVPIQTQWGAPGSAASWTISVTSNDAAGCDSNRFTLMSAVPSGWSATFSQPELVLAPGQSGSSTMQVTSAADAADGFYPVKALVRATTGGSEQVVSGTYAVTRGYDLSLTANIVTSGRNRVLKSSARITASGTPVSGVTVTFTIIRADGSKVTGSATTTTTGDAVYSVKLRNREPAGTWTVTASAAANGIPTTKSTTIGVN